MLQMFKCVQFISLPPTPPESSRQNGQQESQGCVCKISYVMACFVMACLITIIPIKPNFCWWCYFRCFSWAHPRWSNVACRNIRTMLIFIEDFQASHFWFPEGISWPISSFMVLIFPVYFPFSSYIIIIILEKSQVLLLIIIIYYHHYHLMVLLSYSYPIKCHCYPIEESPSEPKHPFRSASWASLEVLMWSLHSWSLVPPNRSCPQASGFLSNILGSPPL